MKKLYWRPTRLPKTALLFISVVAITFTVVIELNQVQEQLPYYQEKVQAANTMKAAMELLKKQREEIYGMIDKKLDPAESGLIGLPTSLITSDTGYLNVKQTTINPNWAAVLVTMLKKTKAQPGDFIALGVSGSFPALSIASLAAADVLGLKVVTISSVAASNWGANIPNLTWLDMEKILFDAGLISTRSVAASLGGGNDSALDLDENGLDLLHQAIKRAEIKFITAKPLKESIDERMGIYREASKGGRIAAYINVGGGMASVGSRKNKRSFKPGLNKRLPAISAGETDGVINRFAKTGIPVIHLSYIDEIADEYGLPKAPSSMPNIGEGKIYGTLRYNKMLAAILLFSLLLLMYTFLRRDIGYRIFNSFRSSQPISPPEPMV